MNGIEFLAQTLERHSGARRVLLTAYADTEAAIRAINEIKLHHYLLKPWNPPEQNLYPVLDELLEDWLSAFRPPFEGLRVLGSRWSPKTYEIREFLARNAVPYQWLDLDSAHRDPEVQRLIDQPVEVDRPVGDTATFPVVLFQDGQRLHQPTPAQLAERIGLRTRADKKFYDLVIVGGGPAGLAAAVYGASEGLRTVIVERDAPGGQAGLSSRIENYLGFPSGLSGADLTRRAVAQARRFGAEILAPQHSVSARAEGTYRLVTLGDGSELSCHALMIATGVQWRKLDIEGMARLHGAGVYYGAGPSEAISCTDEDVYIVGGANSAGQAAMNFSRYARRVVMLVRGPSLAASMSKYLIDEIGQTPNIEVQTGTRVVEVHGEERLEAISIRCEASNSVDKVPASGLYIFIGAEPSTGWLDGFIERDPRGFVLTGQDLMRNGQPPKGWQLDREPDLLETSVPGVFAVGDVRHGSIKRVASGVGEGSIAIQFVHQYLAKVSA
jgi:thioredoxin reductase (NADPH)